MTETTIKTDIELDLYETETPEQMVCTLEKILRRDENGYIDHNALVRAGNYLVSLLEEVYHQAQRDLS